MCSVLCVCLCLVVPTRRASQLDKSIECGRSFVEKQFWPVNFDVDVSQPNEPTRQSVGLLLHSIFSNSIRKTELGSCISIRMMCLVFANCMHSCFLVRGWHFSTDFAPKKTKRKMGKWGEEKISRFFGFTVFVEISRLTAVVDSVNWKSSIFVRHSEIVK